MSLWGTRMEDNGWLTLENAGKVDVGRAVERVKNEVSVRSRESLRGFAGGTVVEVNNQASCYTSTQLNLPLR